jgi:hypothetical protein
VKISRCPGCGTRLALELAKFEAEGSPAMYWRV